MIFRAFRLDGRISTILTQRGSVIGMSLFGRYQTSWCCAGIVYSDDLMTRSGGPKPSLTPCHSLVVTERLGRRQVLRIALQRAAVDPADDRVDLLVAERHVVLELLDADARVDVPRRHLARADALLDRARPRARLLVGDERHRRDRVRLMALLTLGLKNRRDVLRERHLLAAVPCAIAGTATARTAPSAITP